MDDIRFKPLWYVVLAILGLMAIALSGYFTSNWIISSSVGAILYLLSYIIFFIKIKKIDNIFCKDLDKLANSAALVIREEMEIFLYEKEKDLSNKEKDIQKREGRLLSGKSQLLEREVTSLKQQILQLEKSCDDLLVSCCSETIRHPERSEGSP